jgi:FkbM family methyltransferase
MAYHTRIKHIKGATERHLAYRDGRYYWKYFGLATAIRFEIFSRYSYYAKSLIDFSREHLVHTQGGEIITIPNDTGISEELRLFRVHEPLTTAILKHELEEGMICLEIGANIGYYAILERRITGLGGVIAIEPSPLNSSYLKRNLALNGFSDVPVFTLAISDVDGQVDFVAVEQSNWSHVAQEGESGSQTIKVAARKLSTFLRENRIDRFDLMRMDVEGHELAIYNSGRDAIKMIRPNLLMEVHRSLLGANDTINLLREMEEDGYEVKYYIPREIDCVWGSTAFYHVKSLPISELVSQVRDGEAPESYELFLANKKS